MTRGTSWIAASICLFGVSVQAQESSSHVPIREWGESRSNPAKAAEMARALRSQLGQNASIPQNVDPVLFKKLLESLQNNGPQGLERLVRDNPDLANMLRTMAPDDPVVRRQLAEQAQKAGGRSPIDQESLNRLLERFKNSKGSTSPPIGGPSGDPRAAPSQPMDPSGPRPPTGTPPLPSTPPPNMPRDPLSPDDPARAERFREFVRKLDRLVPASVKNSEAMKRLGQKLTDMDWSRLGRNKIIPDSLKPRLNLEQNMRNAGRSLGRALGRLEGRRMPSLPSVRSPNLPGAPSLPSVSPPGMPSSLEAGGAVTTIAVVAAVIAGAYFAWKLLVQPARERRQNPEEWALGSWPVDPSQVRTQEELIKAFDYLALLRGGKIARHWHHQDVADRLGAGDDVKRMTAQRLAGVYELARYAPPQEPVPANQIDMARKDLIVLAGAATP